MVRRDPAIALLVPILISATLAIKAIVLWQLADHPLLQPQGELDSTYYVDLARQIAERGPLAIGQPLFVSPLYVFFLAAVFTLGGGLFAAKIVQIAIGTAAVWLVFAMARRWCGTSAALVAAALAALTGLFTFYEVLILQAALDPFLVALSLYLLTRALQEERARWYLATGLAFGLLALNRPNALAVVVVVIALIAATARLKPGTTTAGEPRRPTVVVPAFRRAWRANAFALMVGVLLILLPNAIRNYAASGELVWISSHGGLNFYIGNHAGADGAYSPVAGISPSIAGQARDAEQVAEAAEGRPLTSGEVSGYFYRRAWEWTRSDPLGAVRLFGWKLLLVLNRTNVPLNYSYAYYAEEEPTILRFLVVGPWLLIPLGIAGLTLLPNPGTAVVGRGFSLVFLEPFWVWASFIPVYALSVAAFFVSSRYRMPLLVPLCVTAGVAVVTAVDRVRTRGLSSIAAPAVAILAVGVACNWNLGLDDGIGGEQTRQAVWLIENGRYDEAQRYADSIAPRHPTPGVFQFRLARALAKAGRADAAIDRFRAAVSVDDQPAIHLELGQALAASGHSAEAVPHLTAALAAGFQPEQSGPWLVRALALSGRSDEAVKTMAALPEAIAERNEEAAFDLGAIALELGAPAQADRWLRAAVARMPNRAEAHEQLGVALLFQNRPAEAIAPLETATRLDPERASAHLNLAVVYAQVGRTVDARREAEASLRLDPNEPRTRELLRALSR